MEKHNNNESAAEADGYADTLTDNSYASTSGCESDESNTSLLERNTILSDKFMLPKDLCENGAIFDEFFSPSIWDSLPPSARQHLAKFLPVSSEERSLSTKVVHDLLSHRLDRFGADQMAMFQHNLAEGNFRTDIVKLRRNLGNSLRKERRIMELQRIARLAHHVVLSREATLLAELQMNGDSSMSPAAYHPKAVNFGHRNRWARHLRGTPELEKCRLNAKKRYLSEIFNVSEAAGLSLSVSDEEDYLDAIPAGPLRKQRRMFGAGQHAVTAGEHAHLPQRHGPTHGHAGVFGSNSKQRGTGAHGSAGASGVNHFDSTTFITPKLFLVTDDHYQRLLFQYRKRKIEDPDHPELNLSGVKLKDVVSRTQIAAGYRRILPLPKVHLPEVKAEGGVLEGNERIKSLKSIKASRLSYDRGDSKNILQPDTTTVLKTEDGSPLKVEPVEERSLDMKVDPMEETSGEFDLIDTKTEINMSISTLCKEEETETVSSLLTTTSSVMPKLDGSFPAHQMEVKVAPSQSKLPHPAPASALPEEGSGEVAMEFMVGNDTHACFLSVVRDLFCSHPDHRSTMEELQVRLDAWSKSSAASRNSWFADYQNDGEWDATLQSAVQFLAGDFQQQPEDFVPYIEHKVALNILQWIGASRDGDCRLVPLCAYWQTRKFEMGMASFRLHHPQLTSMATNTNVSPSVAASGCSMVGSTAGAASTSAGVLFTAKGKNKTSSSVNSKLLLLSSNSSSSSSSSLSSISSITTIGDGASMLADVAATTASLGALGNSQDDDGSVSERSVSPPPPRFPTDWSVRKATDEEVQLFRDQEKQRYENPHMAFTYRQHSYDSVVGPVKGIYTQVPGISKARGHSMLVADRPNFVTILTLVRDATARLPNGEGTRADICELLKSSQYISPTATDQILQTIVSGALDRMHTEHDPCVKYDAKRKIWIYLHRNRTEEEFERLHLQYQGFTKHKKTVARKPAKCHKEGGMSSTARMSKGASLDGSLPSESLSSPNTSHDLELSDLSSCMTDVMNVLETPITTGNIAPSSVGVFSSTAVTSSVRQATSLLKKQSVPVISSSLLVSDRKPDDIIFSGSSNVVKKALSSNPDQSITQPMVTLQHQPQVQVASGSSTKAGGAVTLITSSGSSIKTIKIPKSSLSLANKAAEHVLGAGHTAMASGGQVENSVDNVASSYVTLPQKNVLVSAFVSSAKATPGTATIVSTMSCSNTKLLADVLRKVPSMPIVVQSSTTTQSVQSSATLVSSAMDSDQKVQPGGSILSIRQVNSGPRTMVASSTSSVSPATSNAQMVIQTKAFQFPLTNATIVSSTGGTILQPGTKLSTTMVGMGAPGAKPIFTTSTTSSSTHVRSLPAAASILSQSSSSAVAEATSTATLPQRVVVSTGTAYTTAANSGIPAGVTAKPSTTILTSLGGSPAANTTIIPSSTTHRVIRPSTNLISTITLAKGQQSVLTPAQQKQILQNLLCQQQKQQLLTTKKIVPAVISASSPLSTESPSSLARAGETNPTGLLQENHQPPPTVSTFKLQHHLSANQTMKALSPQIVKITPARAGTASSSVLVSNIGSATTGTVTSVSPLTAQVPAGVKMMKLHQSSILTSTGTHTMLSSAPTHTSAPTPTATMRVLKTATGTTTVIKSGVPVGTPSGQQLSPQTSLTNHVVAAKMRKDGAAPIVSKVTVSSPNVSAGQLIPLESLLQKQGITTTTHGPGVGSTFLKITGTGKTGQPQFLQFSTNTTSTAGGGTQVAAHASPISSVTSGGHQYTIVSQNARNIISVTPTTAGQSTNRSTSGLPVTIVSSLGSDANAASASHVPSTAILGSVQGTSSPPAAAAAGTTILSHGPTAAGKLQHAGKIKLFATSTNSLHSPAFASIGTAQQHVGGTVVRPKTPMQGATVGGGGEFLNAKIIGVRNVTAARVKGASPLSLMNTGNLNIAHIAGKPVIIANSSALTGNPSVTVSTVGFRTNSTANAGSAGVGSGNTVMLTSNPNYSNVLQIEPGGKAKNIINVASSSSTGAESGAGSGSQPGGHPQTQTLMLGNQLVKVQTIQAAAASGKLTHPKRHTLLADGSGSGTPRDANSVPSPMLSTPGGCTVVQQQQQHPPHIGGAGGTTSASSLPKSIAVNSAVALSQSIVKIQQGQSGTNSTAAKLLELGEQQKAAPAQSQRMVLATSSGQLLTQPIILPSGFQSSVPINIKRLKVIPVSKPPASKK